MIHRITVTLIPKYTLKSYLITIFYLIYTDSVGSSSGFSAVVSLTESLCGQSNYHLNNSNSVAILSSPGSTKYSPNTRCDWIIETSGDDIIRLHFKKLDIEQSDFCANDNVQIIDENVIKNSFSFFFRNKLK